MNTPPAKTLFFILLLHAIQYNNVVTAQEVTQNGNEIIERIAETYAENYNAETDLTPLLEDLQRHIENPFNINTATRNDFEKLHFLTTFQIENLLAYLHKYGQVYSQYELQAIEGFNRQTASDLAVFVQFLPPDEEERTYWNQAINMRYRQYLETKSGFNEDDDGNSKFAGIKPNLLLKYRVEKGNKFQFGFTAENDEGEEFFSGHNPYGFDFYSAFASFQFQSFLKEVYIGDYQVKTGQGLISWSGYGKRKSSQGINIRPMRQGLRGYTSTDENNHLRGVAARFRHKKYDVITYYSYHHVDANVTETDTSDTATKVSSIKTTGYHRTNDEISDRDVQLVQTAGAQIRYTINRFSAGINSAFQIYDIPIEPSQQLYKRYSFSGRRNYNLSTDFLWVFNRVNFFGEAAISRSKGSAIISGLEAQPANEISFSLLYRNYAPDFHSINGQAFSESGGNKNEEGFYTGWSILPFPKIKLSGYVDFYRSHWLKFTSSAPVRGTDFMLQTDYSPTNNIEIYLRYKNETNSEKAGELSTIRHDTGQNTQRLRLNAQFEINDRFNLKFRTEVSKYKKEKNEEKGIMTFADFNGKPLPKFKFNARFAWFNTSNYDSRIYAYENDVLHYFYIPAFFSEGLRYYLNMKYNLSSKLKIYLKIAQTYYLDDSFEIGSGNAAIEGNKRTGFKV
ncbi:MAG TPA: helix-hairpin-helix domain-containing protein, partial [Prolixibacteraceae bacterium]|nr:helix-hairpin-helix domain-containing protein [Prolixibacteraceae bacterium]